ncbi:MAG: T9SS type A sorting domain-containing protein [Saprospiraceae bacterium]|nr:T9SS type A sorting domain-containing protein [Saprospiraceae bacterium]
MKFNADMDFYNWILDDVQLIKKEGNNLVLANNFIARAPIYSMPQIAIDSVRFLADVANVGANDQTNVALSVNVVRNSDNASVFTATNSYGMMMAGDTVENKAFSAVFFPDTTLASYTVTYTLASDSTDALPGDNTFSYQFEVVDDFFDKTAGFTRNITPSANNAWTYGTSYYVNSGVLINGTNNLDTLHRAVTAVSFGASNPTELAGESVTIFLEKPITGSVLDANGSGAIEQAERTIVAFGTYTFTGSEAANAILNVAMEDFNTGKVYELQSNTNYALVVNFVPNNATVDFRMLAAQGASLNYSAADFAAAQNGVERYSELLDVGNSGDYGTNGFVGSPVPFVRLNVAEYFTTSANDVKLEENALTVFPNPADEFITATITLEEMSANAKLTIFNVNGQIVETRNLSNVKNEQVLFDLDAYASGTYLISIDTEFGHSIKRFIVSK